MPFINIKTAGRPLADGEVRALQRETTDLMARVMGKKAGLTAVLVEQMPAAGWSIGGAPLDGGGLTTARVDIKITQGTNTADDKARMIAEAHALLGRVLGNLSPVSYVVIDEVPATDWGYGGLTQAARRLKAA